MKIEYLEDITDIGEAFIERFVLTWDSFQIKHKDWIAEMSKRIYPIDRHWYDQSYIWDRMDPAFPRVSLKEDLD